MTDAKYDEAMLEHTKAALADAAKAVWLKRDLQHLVCTWRDSKRRPQDARSPMYPKLTMRADMMEKRTAVINFGRDEEGRADFLDWPEFTKTIERYIVEINLEQRWYKFGLCDYIARINY